MTTNVNELVNTEDYSTLTDEEIRRVIEFYKINAYDMGYSAGFTAAIQTKSRELSNAYKDRARAYIDAITGGEQ